MEYSNEEISREILRHFGYQDDQLKKEQLMLRCCNPNHQDKHASMSVNLEKMVYNCFSCGFKGSLKDLYYTTFGRSIYKDMGIKNIAFRRPQVIERINFDEAPETDFQFEGNLIDLSLNENGKAWAAKRGFSPSLCSLQGIRFLPFGKTWKPSENGDSNQKVCYYSNCAIIPIYEGNKLLSFEARDTLGKEVWAENLKKRGLNPEDHQYKKVLYPTGSSINTLYDLKNLKTDQTLYFTEGLMDMLSLRTEKEFKNSTCIFHCNATERQIYLLSKFEKLVYIVDNDLPGLNACLKMMKNLKLEGKLYFLQPPLRDNIKDVNDILQGKDPVIKSVKNLLDMNWLKQESNNPELLETIIAQKQRLIV